MQVAQWIEWTAGEAELYGLLREVFDHDYPPTSLHRWLACAAKALDAEGLPQLLVVTMNYDDLVERAFADERLACDVVWYYTDHRVGPHFVHQPPNGEPQLIQSPPSTRATGTARTPSRTEAPRLRRQDGCSP